MLKSTGKQWWVHSHFPPLWEKSCYFQEQEAKQDLLVTIHMKNSNISRVLLFLHSPKLPRHMQPRNTSDDNTGSASFFCFFFYSPNQVSDRLPKHFHQSKKCPIKIVRIQISITSLWISPSRWTSNLMKYCQLAQFIKNIFFVRIGYIIKTIGKHL